MPRDSSGNYTLPLGNPVVDGTVISVDWANPTMADIAVQLNNVLTRDGLLAPILPFYFVDGTPALPGIAFISQNGTGLWKDATQVGISYAGVAKQTWAAGLSSISTKLSVQAPGDYVLEVASSANTAIARFSGLTLQDRGLVISSFAPAGANAAGFNFNAPGAAGVNGTLSFSTNSVERMRIDAAGNVGIGVTPSAWGAAYRVLQVGGTAALWADAAANAAVRLTAGAYFSSSYIARTANGAAQYALADNTHVWYTAAPVAIGAALTMTERMRIDAGGNVGIGLSPGAAKLGVNNSAIISGPTSPFLCFSPDQATTPAFIDYAVASSNLRLTSANSDGVISFRTAGGGPITERMRIDAAGNVLCQGALFSKGILAATFDGGIGAFAFANGDLVVRRSGTLGVIGFGGDNNNSRLTGTTNMQVGTGFSSFSPASNGGINLGESALRWATVYAVSGTINTSDSETKEDILPLSDAERQVAQSIKGLFRSYKLTDSVATKGEAARIHIGVMAQDVKAAFAAAGLDAHRYGLFCEDEWYDIPGLGIDHPKHNQKVDASEPGAVYHKALGIRYSELLAFVVAAM